MEKTSTGLPESISGLLCYVGFWVTGVIFILIESSNKTVRFHAFQSTIVFALINIAYFVFYFVPYFGWIANFLLSALAFILWVVFMFKAYQGQKWKIPLIGSLAEKWANR